VNNQLLACKDLTRVYERGGQQLVVLDQLDLEINRGEFVAIMGPSGSGKSTLLNLIGGLDKPTTGSINVDGVDLHKLSERTLTNWRASTVGFVFQFYNLISVLSAEGNVALPLLLTDLSARDRKKRAQTALDIVGLAGRRDHKPNELSGGQQQRVAIARAIVTDPTLLVCDEPTGDLDRNTADEILALLTQLNEEFNKTIVMVTHDPKAADAAGSLLHMDAGALVTTTEVQSS